MEHDADLAEAECLDRMLERDLLARDGQAGGRGGLGDVAGRYRAV